MVTFSAGLESVIINREPDFGDTLELDINNEIQFRAPHMLGTRPKTKNGTLTFSLINVNKTEYDAFEIFRNKNYGRVMTVDIDCHKKRYIALIEDVTIERGKSYPKWEEIERTYLTLPDWHGPTGHFSYIWVTELERKLGGCLFYDIDLSLSIFSDGPIPLPVS